MYTRITQVINKSGLHARPAASFVTEAIRYQAGIRICSTERPEHKVNAKSITLLLSLSLKQGVSIQISADGDDEQEAVDSLIRLVEAGLGE